MSKQTRQTSAIGILRDTYKAKGFGGWYQGMQAQILKAVLSQGECPTCYLSRRIVLMMHSKRYLIHAQEPVRTVCIDHHDPVEASPSQSLDESGNSCWRSLVDSIPGRGVVFLQVAMTRLQDPQALFDHPLSRFSTFKCHSGYPTSRPRLHQVCNYSCKSAFQDRIGHYALCRATPFPHQVQGLAQPLGSPGPGRKSGCCWSGSVCYRPLAAHDSPLAVQRARVDTVANALVSLEVLLQLKIRGSGFRTAHRKVPYPE